LQLPHQVQQAGHHHQDHLFRPINPPLAQTKALDDQRLKDFPAFGKVAQTIQPHGIEALEDIKGIVIAGGMAVLIKEALNLLETSNDPFFARRPAECLLWYDLDA